MAGLKGKRKFSALLALLIAANTAVPAVSTAQTMYDYCMVPPFIIEGIQPNLLLMIDNSASMYDLAYIDEGTAARKGTYCYDQTYVGSKTYAGYFESGGFYEYDLSGAVFRPIASLPGPCTKNVPGTLCIDLDTTTSPATVTGFSASGNYLNWLSASKLDVEKKILTGGKYDSVNNVLIGETRGCVGRRYVKEALTADYVEAGTNTSLGITFGIRGPKDAADPSLPSLGGQAYIEIFDGNYDETICQQAIDNIVSGQLGQAKSDIKGCLAYPSGASQEAKEGAVFNQAMQACMALEDGTPLGIDEVNTIRNQCPDIYAYTGGPKDIPAESPGYLCSRAYAGRCYSGTYGDFDSVWVRTREAGALQGDDCILYFHKRFCTYEFEKPPVIDPSNPASETVNYDNVPALISDTGVLAQLDKPLLTMTVQIDEAASPEGLIQDFSDLIRFGAMSFNFDGSDTECDPTWTDASKVIKCQEDSDGNLLPVLDGGQIIHYVGDPVGDHDTGLINAIDDIEANTWTPFTEAFYNAIGYFAGDTNRRLNTNDFDVSKNPVQYRCQRNNVLIVSDGITSADLNADVLALASSYNDGDGQVDTAAADPACIKYEGTRNLDDLTWLAQTRKISDFTQPPVEARDTISTFVVYSGPSSEATDECNPAILMEQTAQNGGGSYQSAEDPGQLKSALRNAFTQIAAKSASGTAASVLASGEGTGANLIQALFYPKRRFGTTDISWSGVLQNFWYYIDPRLASNNIREDTVGDFTLSLGSDNIVSFRFDGKETKADLWQDTDGDGDADAVAPGSPVGIDEVKYLWEAGKELFKTAPADRAIYFNNAGALDTFDDTKAAALQPLLNVADSAEAAKLINYVRGLDDLDKDGVSGDADEDGANDDPDDTIEGKAVRNRTVTFEGATNTWKLGDVVNSTPKLISWVKLHHYDEEYGAKDYEEFTETGNYPDRGMVFAGGNDGMLHAIKLGKLELLNGSDKKARLSGTNLGKEMWAFIPRNALPYLKYFAEQDYCHLYYIDATPLVFEASTGKPAGCAEANYYDCDRKVDSWKTILIGSMRLGGACADSASTYEDRVKTPVSGVGFSSYFALDITNPETPKLMWEFKDAAMGYSLAAPAVVRIGDKSKNGRWLAVIGSGPTGWVSPGTHQFTGVSTQNLVLKILDIETGTVVHTITSKSNAFAGSLLNSTMDLDLDWQDDVLYFGYTAKNADSTGITGATGAAVWATANTITLAADASGVDDYYNGYFISLPGDRTKLIIDYDGATKTATLDSKWGTVPAAGDSYTITYGWTKGGVLKLLTKENVVPAGNWELQDFMTGIGPVTSKVEFLQDFDTTSQELWTFFGTGRYFYKTNEIIDDAANQRKIYGVKDLCLFVNASGKAELDPTCTTPVGTLQDRSAGPFTTGIDGWYITLDPLAAGGDFAAERLVTHPNALINGNVFFTTTQPSADTCNYGGRSYIWAVCYSTGGPPGSASKCRQLSGTAMLQVSTGAIEELKLSEAFNAKEGRRTASMTGIPPVGSGLNLQLPPLPIKQIIFMQEQ